MDRVYNCDTKIPLSLTNNIPIMVLLSRFLGFHQYFGLWFLISNILFAFFSYRISKNIFRERHHTAIALSSIVFMIMPFIWYHNMYVPWMAGQWTILWAYSLFFKNTDYPSDEWYGVMIVSSFINPYFAMICFFIMVTNIMHIYIFKHTVSSVKAAECFSNYFAVVLLAMGVIGAFYTGSYLIPYSVEPLNLTEHGGGYNISFLNVGYGVLLGVAVLFVLTFFNKKLQIYIFNNRSMVAALFMFAGFGIIGGVITPHFEMPPTNLTIFHIISSGPKMFIPVLLVIPVFFSYAAYQLEKNRTHSGVLFLGLVVLVQVLTTPSLKQLEIDRFTPLPENARLFIQDAEHLEWIFLDEQPFTPPAYEQLAYFAYQSNITINAVPVVRFPTGYSDALAEDKELFLEGIIDPFTVYVFEYTPAGLYYSDDFDILEFDGLTLLKMKIQI